MKPLSGGPDKIMEDTHSVAADDAPRTTHSVAADDAPRTGRQKFWFVAKIVGALLVVAMLVALAILRTWPPLNVVMTGSMEPAIDTGDVVIMGKLDRPAEVGDIVKVRPPQEIQDRLNYPDSVIHRIVKIDDGTVFTKGDARDERDPFTVPLDDVNTRVVGQIPGIGQIVAFFTSPLGLIWLVAGALLFILIPYFELRRDQVETEKAELSTLALLRMELHDVAQRVDGEHGGGSRAPPGLPAVPVSVPGTGADLDDDAGFADGDFAEVEGEAIEFEPEPGELEAELEEMKARMDELVGAVGEYGEHLRSHTEVLKGMSAASQDLAATVAALRGAVPGAGAAADSATNAAERILAQWRLRRAEEIAGWMGFHDAEDAARLAVLDDSTDDEDIEAALRALAAEKPYLRKS